MTTKFKRLIHIAILFAVPFLIVSCGGDEAVEEQVRVPVESESSEVAEVEVVEEVEEVEPLLEEESASEKQRNPFKTFIVKRVGGTGDFEEKSDLECCPLGAFTVKAIISGFGSSAALIVAPNGERYTLKMGMMIGVNEGTVVGISKAGIMVREVIRNMEGIPVGTDDVVMTLPVKGGG